MKTPKCFPDRQPFAVGYNLIEFRFLLLIFISCASSCLSFPCICLNLIGEISAVKGSRSICHSIAVISERKSILSSAVLVPNWMLVLGPMVLPVMIGPCCQAVGLLQMNLCVSTKLFCNPSSVGGCSIPFYRILMTGVT